MFAIAVALAIAAPKPFPIDLTVDQGALIRKKCAIRYPSDFQMQSACGRNAVKGMERFLQASRSVGDALDGALTMCVRRYTEKGLPDWMMIGACASNQAEAYRQLHR